MTDHQAVANEIRAANLRDAIDMVEVNAGELERWIVCAALSFDAAAPGAPPPGAILGAARRLDAAVERVRCAYVASFPRRGIRVAAREFRR